MADLDIATEADTRRDEDAADRRERYARERREVAAQPSAQMPLDFGGSDGVCKR